jgi:Piwi domain
MDQTDHPHIFTEVFPVRTMALSPIIAYKLDCSDDESSIIGGKSAYRLRHTFAGHWVWTGHRIITDNSRRSVEMERVIEALWQEQPDIFSSLHAIVEDPEWQPTAQAQADFVARGLLMDLGLEIRPLLAAKAQDLGRVRVELVHEVRGWVVDGQAAVSISIASRLLSKEDVKAYAARLTNGDSLLGLWVADKTSTLKGEIVGITGQLAAHRRRLLTLTQRSEMRQVLDRADEDELVVRVRAGSARSYEYVASALRIIVRTEDFRRFHINAQQALKALRLGADLRAQLVKPIADLAKTRHFIADGYTSQRSPTLFLRARDVGYAPRLCFGGNQVRPYDEKALFSHLRACGLYKRAERFSAAVPIRIGVLNALGGTPVHSFLSSVQRVLQGLDFQSHLLHEEEVHASSRHHLEAAIENLHKENPDIIIALFPDECQEDEEAWGAYHHFKSLTIGSGIAGQVVYQATMKKSYAIANIVLGILGKTGNIPFILADPLEYADLVVGIDIARRRKERLAGSINATAIARLYFNTGEFLRYVIHDAPLEGETIPDHVLQSLFPAKEFQGKRVVIHRDGYFRGEEKRDLQSWAQRIGAAFFFVEVLKTGTPRLYARQKGHTFQPSKAESFKLSLTEAFLVSSLPPFEDATPQPLHLRTEPPFTIERAIHSVLALTLLHYGSLRPPRLPVTIHYSDRIAYLALMGIKPRNLEGTIPFWL